MSSLIKTYLSFQLGQELFSTDVSKVLEILEMRQITKVPQSPAYMKGVINLRGSVLPVIDLRLKFGMAEADLTIDSCIIVLSVEIEGENITLGALVDSVNEVLEIDEEKIEAAPTIGTKYKAEFIQGMWKKDEIFIMLLDIDKVFQSIEVTVLQNTEQE